MTNVNNSASRMYAVSLDQAVDWMLAIGHKRTALFQGDMGTGKTSMGTTLAERLPNHTLCYFDCTTKDLGDIMIPKMKEADGQDFVRFATNEELGMHLNKPIILMVDEFGKANPAVKNGLLRIMLERKIGSATLHPDSIVFATSNLGAEGVGDLLPAHARNRLSVMTVRKPNNMEWIEWAINKELDHSLLGWCKDNPQLFHGFYDHKDPEENPYIFHPKSQRTSFVTPRSLEAASDILKVRDSMDDVTLTGSLMGTIGERGAMDLMAFVKISDQLPSLDSIKSDPANAKVPTSAAAVCMVVYRTLATIERNWLDNWMTYLNRLDKEAQGMFANGVRAKSYSKQSLVMTNKKFTDWAMRNNYLFSSDVK